MRDSARTGFVVLAAAFVGIGLVVAAAVVMLDVSAARAITGPATGNGPILALQTAPDAEQVFFDQCAPCHGIEGQGGIGPSLIASTLSVDEELQVIRTGRDAMPAFENTLGNDTIEALSALLSRLAATRTYDQQCGPCHGVSGKGGIGPAVDSGNLLYEDLRLVISDGAGAMPAFRPTLTDDQLEGVTAFVQHLALIRIGSELYAGLCTACHGVNGEGGAGPALAGSDVTAAEISALVGDGSGAMPEFGSSLADNELEAIDAFTRRLVAGLVAPQPLGANGADLYVQLCAACHGADGEGGAGPALAPLAHSDQEVTTFISNGTGGMPGFGSDLSDEAIGALVEYVQSSFGEVAVPTTSGPDLYVQLCAVCHGTSGEGGVGPSLAPLTTRGDELATLINEGRGSMPGFATQISADGLVELVGFLEADFGEVDVVTTTTLAVPIRSGAELYAENCARCHLADGSGDTGPDLRDTELSLNEIISITYGGHTGGMPAFDGELSGSEVQGVARFIATLHVPEGERTAVAWWLWPMLLVVVAAVGAAGFVAVMKSRARKASALQGS